MLTAKNLERMMALEEKLRDEYQEQLDAKSAEIEKHIKEKEDQKTRLDTQLKEIGTLSKEASSSKKIEQRNRELHQRCENLQEDIATQKKRLKALQEDLAEEREEVKVLKQFDPAKMKKNLDANKKKLTEKTTANDLLQKSLNRSKGENAELQRKVKELEAKLAEVEGKLAEVEGTEEVETVAP